CAVTASFTTAFTTPGIASAQPTSPPPPAPATRPAPAPATAAPAAAAPEPSDEPSADDRERDASVEQLASRIAELEDKLAAQRRPSAFPVKLTGYGDLGLFATQGDGTGFRRDIGHKVFPGRSEFGWVFYGDLLATQVNSRGDVADLGHAPGVDRFDSVHSEGNLTFLVNELNLGVQAGLGSSALFTSSVNFTPRTGTDFRLGDSFDLDLAQLEWMPTRDGNTSIFIGKVDSVLGIEYKERKAPERFGITPSLIARYTTGTAIGIKARTKLAGDHLVLSAAVTNGSFGTEQFHFYRETDSNNFKTLSGRAALRFPVGAGTLELGPSGQWGTQDGLPDDGGAMWFVGADAELAMPRFDIKAQWLKGKAPGDEVTMTYALELKQGGYVETNVIVTPILGLSGRAELRDAEVRQGTARLYITKNWRATAGMRLIFSPHAILKAEYSHNGEYGGSPSIPDDVVTTSAVMAF
ncbi:MAG TPA: hypothetical protein VFK02_24090, partial [Kofleriaceae bacterium]|nr:hypothetical protein [Kofleriaceae bacterium]